MKFVFICLIFVLRSVILYSQDCFYGSENGYVSRCLLSRKFKYEDIHLGTFRSICSPTNCEFKDNIMCIYGVVTGYLPKATTISILANKKVYECIPHNKKLKVINVLTSNQYGVVKLRFPEGSDKYYYVVFDRRGRGTCVRILLKENDIAYQWW